MAKKEPRFINPSKGKIYVAMPDGTHVTVHPWHDRGRFDDAVYVVEGEWFVGQSGVAGPLAAFPSEDLPPIAVTCSDGTTSVVEGLDGVADPVESVAKSPKTGAVAAPGTFHVEATVEREGVVLRLEEEPETQAERLEYQAFLAEALSDEWVAPFASVGILSPQGVLHASRETLLQVEGVNEDNVDELSARALAFERERQAQSEEGVETPPPAVTELSVDEVEARKRKDRRNKKDRARRVRQKKKKAEGKSPKRKVSRRAAHS